MNQFALVLMACMMTIFAQQQSCALLDEFPQAPQEQQQQKPRVDPSTKKIEGPSDGQTSNKTSKKKTGKEAKSNTSQDSGEVSQKSRLNVLLKKDADPAALERTFRSYKLKKQSQSSRTENQWIYSFDYRNHDINKLIAALSSNTLVQKVTAVE